MNPSVFSNGLWSVVMVAMMCGGSGFAKEPVQGKEEVPATILFVNAVQDPGVAFLVLDGVDANPAGFAMGLVTGWVQFPAGERVIEVEHQPLGKVVVEKKLVAGSRLAFIAYKVMEDQSARGRPLKPTIGVLTVACDDEVKVPNGKRRVVLVNTTMREEVTVEVGDKKVLLKRLKPETLAADMGGGFIVVKPVLEAGGVEAVSAAGVAEGGSVAIATLNVEEPMVSYVVVFEAADGVLGAATFSGPEGKEGEK